MPLSLAPAEPSDGQRARRCHGRRVHRCHPRCARACVWWGGLRCARHWSTTTAPAGRNSARRGRRVPHRRGAGACRQRLQGSQGELSVARAGRRVQLSPLSTEQHPRQASRVWCGPSRRAGEAHHAPPLATRHPRRRGARHAHQGERQPRGESSAEEHRLKRPGGEARRGAVRVDVRALGESSPRTHAHTQATIAGGGVIPHIHKSLINKLGKPEKI